ncbi:TonB-dependent receptor domain-containing protein [Tenacibaculum sp. TC6]|uniref:TonB-dependent receptor domain-containing protein n=1 Tax=Tenacibaculum sp. TC6 TaxID=3423223 RepID=UPI003D36A15F
MDFNFIKGVCNTPVRISKKTPFFEKGKVKGYQKRFLELLAFLFLTTVSFGQQKYGNITTKIIDDTKQGVEFATNVLYKAQDSTIVKIVMSETDGTVSFEGVRFGEYYMHTSYVGFKEVYTNIKLDTPLKEVPVIQLQSSMVLEEVVVNSRRKLVQKKIDRIVLDVGATMTADGGNLSDVLKISPGVNVGNNGAVTLRGKTGVIVLIDGRRSYLKGTDLENYINSMPANQFSKIEVMTNPPAKYDADGNAGVINIVTNRNYQKGWEIDIASSYKQGRYAEIANSIGWNANTKSVNIFGNVSFTDKNDFDDYKVDRNFRDINNNLESIFAQNTFIKRENNFLTSRLGLDYFINPKTTIGFLIGSQFTKGESFTTNNTQLKDNANTVTQTLIAPAKSDVDYTNIQANVHAIHKFDDSTGKTISLDLDYLRYKSTIDQNFENNLYDNSGNLTSSEILLNNLPQLINIYTAKIDYTHPISDESKVEVGAKTSFVKTDNNAKYYEKVGSQLVENINLSNHFKYDENVNAAYLNYTQSFGSLTMQAGVRVEQTKVEGNQITQNTKFENKYTKVLPSVFLTYDLDEESQVGISYGRRIQRPDYRDLNPFRYFYDKYTFEEGNPALNPQFSNNYELSYSTFGGAITLTGYYNKTEDIITDVIFQNTAQNETYIKKDNLNDLTVYGVSLNAGLPITERWTTSLNLNYSQNKLEGMVNGNNFDIKTGTFTGFMLNQYKLGGTWKFELGAWYTSKSLTDTFIQEPYGKLALAIGKSLWGGRGKIRLSGNDVFGWNKFVGKSAFPNTDVSIDNTWQTKTIKLAFTYKLSGGYTKSRKDRESSIEQESDRLTQYK